MNQREYFEYRFENGDDFFMQKFFLSQIGLILNYVESNKGVPFRNINIGNWKLTEHIEIVIQLL